MKVLVLRFSSIGDIVLTTPVMRCLKQQKGATIHYLTKSFYADLLAPNPYIDRIFSFEKDIDADTWKILRAERYDLVVDLHHNLRSMGVKIGLARPSRSFPKLNLQKWLLVNLKINLMPKRHIVDRYMETVRDLGVVYDGQGLDHFIPPDATLDGFPLPPTPFIAFAIGATHNTKRLPAEHIIDLCRRAHLPVVLLGGKAESKEGAMIAAEAGNHVHNFCGQMNLHQSALVLQASAQVLTHDTGLMHIAAALRKPIVSFWGSTVPDFGMWPFYPTGMELNTSVEKKGLSCRPCSKIGFERCPKGHFNCMRELDFTFPE